MDRDENQWNPKQVLQLACPARWCNAACNNAVWGGEPCWSTVPLTLGWRAKCAPTLHNEYTVCNSSHATVWHECIVHGQPSLDSSIVIACKMGIFCAWIHTWTRHAAHATTFAIIGQFLVEKGVEHMDLLETTEGVQHPMNLNCVMVWGASCNCVMTTAKWQIDNFGLPNPGSMLLSCINFILKFITSSFNLWGVVKWVKRWARGEPQWQQSNKYQVCPANVRMCFRASFMPNPSTNMSFPSLLQGKQYAPAKHAREPWHLIWTEVQGCELDRSERSTAYHSPKQLLMRSQHNIGGMLIQVIQVILPIQVIRCWNLFKWLPLCAFLLATKRECVHGGSMLHLKSQALLILSMSCCCSGMKSLLARWAALFGGHPRCRTLSEWSQALAMLCKFYSHPHHPKKSTHHGMVKNIYVHAATTPHVIVMTLFQ